MSCYLCPQPFLVKCVSCLAAVCLEHISETKCSKCEVLFPDSVVLEHFSDLRDIYVSTFVKQEPKMNVDLSSVTLTPQVRESTDILNKKMVELIEDDKKDYVSLKTRAYYNMILSKMLEEEEVDNVKFKNIIRGVNNTMIVPISKIIDVDVDASKKKKKTIFTIPLPVEENTFTLKGEDQETHAKCVLKMLETKHLCLDTSHAGSGKTYVSLNAIRNLNIKNLILFTPKIMKEKWIDILLTFTNKELKFIHFTYPEISCRSFIDYTDLFTLVKHTNRTNVELKKGILKYITNETIVILDEVHNLKETSKHTFKFISQVTQAVSQADGYVLGLSATPVEKEKEKKDIVNKLSMAVSKKFDLANNDYIYHSSENQVYIPSSATSFSKNIEYFMEETRLKILKDFDDMNVTTERDLNHLTTVVSILPETFKQLLQLKKRTGANLIRLDKNVLNFIYQQPDHIFKIVLYRYIEDVLGNLYSRDMVIKVYYLCLLGWDLNTVLNYLIRDGRTIKRIIENSYEDIFNACCFNILIHLERRDECEFEKAVALTIDLKPEDMNIIENAFSVVLEKETVITLNILAAITKGLIISEITYVPYIVNLVKEVEPQKKVVVGIHYRSTMQLLRESFPSALYVDGTVKNKQKVIDDFQKTNNSVMFINLRSLNSGVDLDDKVGDKPRVVFIIPDFKFSEQIQFMYRFKRMDSKSEPFIYFIQNHIKIIQNLLDKSRINKSLSVTIPDLTRFKQITEEDL